MINNYWPFSNHLLIILVPFFIMTTHGSAVFERLEAAFQLPGSHGRGGGQSPSNFAWTVNTMGNLAPEEGSTEELVKISQGSTKESNVVTDSTNWIALSGRCENTWFVPHAIVQRALLFLALVLHFDPSLVLQPPRTRRMTEQLPTESRWSNLHVAVLQPTNRSSTGGGQRSNVRRFRQGLIWLKYGICGFEVGWSNWSYDFGFSHVTSSCQLRG